MQYSLSCALDLYTFLNMSLILHKTDVSPPARAVMMVLEILGLEAKYKEVSIPTREHFKPEFLKKNPMHSVPLLEDGNLILADSHAIITYLVSKYGAENEKLYPKDLGKRAIIDQRLYFDASVLFPRLRSVIYGVAKKYQKAPTELQLSDIEDGYEILEKYLENSKYLAGDDITLADVSCVATVSSLDCVVPINSKYGKLLAWWARIQEMEWYENKNLPGLSTFNFFMRSLLG